MGDVIDPEDRTKPFEDDPEFISDLARFADGLLSEAAVKKKYRLAESACDILGDNDALVEKVEAEKLRRIRDGSTKRQRAQQLVVQAPIVLGTIMNDPTMSARHRIDSAKALDDFAANGPGAAAAADRFIIQINLGDDVLKVNKSIKPDANDVDPFNDVDTRPQGMIAAIAAKKPPDGGNGEPI